MKPRRNAARNAAAGPKPAHCPICLKPDGPGVRKLVWDHVHSTGKFRGWICCEDNRMIGLACDDPERLRRAAAYLELDTARNPRLPWQRGK